MAHLSAAHGGAVYSDVGALSGSLRDGEALQGGITIDHSSRTNGGSLSCNPEDMDVRKNCPPEALVIGKGK
jgi:hypothetical protein